MNQEDAAYIEALKERTKVLEERVAELEAKWPPATHEKLAELFKKLREVRSNIACYRQEEASLLWEIEAAALQVKKRY